jgi:uncharacterized protein YcbK (DUF882 family)
MQLSKHFKREEFRCGDGCGFDTVDSKLLEILEDVRVFYDAPITINSACRCYLHNKNVGGGEHSQHLLGRAADIVVKGVDPRDLAHYLRERYPDKFGIGEYDTFTHIDSRNTKGRW